MNEDSIEYRMAERLHDERVGGTPWSALYDEEKRYEVERVERVVNLYREMAWPAVETLELVDAVMERRWL